MDRLFKPYNVMVLVFRTLIANFRDSVIQGMEDTFSVKIKSINQWHSLI